MSSKAPTLSPPSRFIDGQWTELNLAEIEQHLYDEGCWVAKYSGARSSEPEVVASLEELADKAAARLGAAAYDPATNVADEYAETKYRALLAEAEELKQQVDFARAAWRDRSSELAALGDGPEAPSFPLLVAVAGVLAIGLTIAPTLHDLLFVVLIGRGVPALAWSFVCGSLVASLLVWGILGRSDAPEGSRSDRLTWTGIGLLFGVALFLMRSSVTSGGAEFILSAGLGLLEAVFVLLVERIAAARARHVSSVEEGIALKMAAERQLGVAEQYLHDRLAAQTACEEKLTKHREAVREREHLVRAAPKFREAARAAIRAGYEAGLASNRGIVNDGAFAPPTAKDVRVKLMAAREKGQ